MNPFKDEVDVSNFVLTDTRMEEIFMEMKNSDWKKCLMNCSLIMELIDEAILITSRKIKEHFPTKELFEEKKTNLKTYYFWG
jgi:hypothetical protein